MSSRIQAVLVVGVLILAGFLLWWAGSMDPRGPDSLGMF